MRGSTGVASFLVVAGAWVAGAGLASADVYKTGSIFYSEDFQSGSNTTHPSDIAWAGIGQSSRTTVVSDPTASGNSVLRMNMESGNNNGSGLAITFTNESAPTQAVVNFRFYINQINTVNNLDVFRALNKTSAGASDGNTAFGIFVQNGHFLFSGKGASPYRQDTGIAATTGAWHTISLQYDLSASANAFVLTIDGNAPITYSTSGSISPVEIRRIFLAQYGNMASTTVYWDDIVISDIPEPASLGMVGLGGLVMLRRSPKK